jgi:hypothetical protein
LKTNCGVVGVTPLGGFWIVGELRSPLPLRGHRGTRGIGDTIPIPGIAVIGVLFACLPG